MIDDAFAREFGQKIIDTWNSRDLMQILSLYAEDVVAENPFFTILFHFPDGILRGKAALLPYWQMVLENLPPRPYKLLDVYAGANSIALQMIALFDKRSIKVFTVNEQHLITSTRAFYDSLTLPR